MRTYLSSVSRDWSLSRQSSEGMSSLAPRMDRNEATSLIRLGSQSQKEVNFLANALGCEYVPWKYSASFSSISENLAGLRLTFGGCAWKEMIEQDQNSNLDTLSILGYGTPNIFRTICRIPRANRDLFRFIEILILHCLFEMLYFPLFHLSSLISE